MEQTYDPQRTFDVPPLKFIATKGCTIVSNLLLADTHTLLMFTDKRQIN